MRPADVATTADDGVFGTARDPGAICCLIAGFPVVELGFTRVILNIPCHIERLLPGISLIDVRKPAPAEPRAIGASAA
jgi:hypothetical protein